MYIFHQIISIYFNKLESNSDNKFYKILFDMFIEKKYSIHEKYLCLNEQLSNIFLTEKMKDEFLGIFGKFQKTYLAINKFNYIIRHKKSVIVVENDLSLNPISEKDKNIIVIYQDNNKYLFHIRDIIKLINNCIGHSNDFFSFPLSIKNPYNNVILTKSSLYNIYFFMKFKTLYFSELLHKFFLCNFDLTNYFEKNIYFLRKYSIEDNIKNYSTSRLYMYTCEMLYEYNNNNTYRFNKIEIDSEFSHEKIVQIMKPYLNLYFISKYSLLQIDKTNATKKLKKKLGEFYRFNPLFGRKMIEISNKDDFVKQPRINATYYFVEKHIQFYKNQSTIDFLDSHKSVKEEIENEPAEYNQIMNEESDENEEFYDDRYEDEDSV